MILQVDPKTLGQNLFLLIGLLIVVVLGALLCLGIWIGLRLWIAGRRERRSWEEFEQQRRAPDGRPYPAFIDGICRECGRGDARIYHGDAGEELCPSCYDESCRRANQTDASPPADPPRHSQPEVERVPQPARRTQPPAPHDARDT
jgi:hypothetical protein